MCYRVVPPLVYIEEEDLSSIASARALHRLLQIAGARVLEITGDYQKITGDYHRLLEITGDYQRLLEITGDYQRLPQITGDYQRLLEITRGYWRSLGVVASYMYVLTNKIPVDSFQGHGTVTPMSTVILVTDLE